MPEATVHGVRLHYDDRGAGPPLLFQHGYTSAGDAWDEVVARLVDRYRCITLDSRGTGDSEHPGHGYEIEQLARDVLGLADALGLARFTYVGHSMGGGIGMRLALDHPERLERLVLVAPIGAAGFTVDPAVAQGFPEADPIDAATLARMVDARIAGQARPERADRARSELRVRRALSVDPAYRAAGDASMRAFGVRDRLGEITTPTLMVAGAADALLADNLHDFALLPHATLHVFSRVGHGVAGEVPAAFARVLADFMEHGVVTAETLAERARRQLEGAP